MSGKIENFGAFDKNTKIVRKYMANGAVNIGDLPHREAMRLIQNETDAVRAYTVQLNDFIQAGNIGSGELVYILVAMSRTLKMLKKAIRDFDPELYEKYKQTSGMCEHFMDSEAVIVPREKGDKNE